LNVNALAVNVIIIWILDREMYKRFFFGCKRLQNQTKTKCKTIPRKNHPSLPPTPQNHLTSPPPPTSHQPNTPQTIPPPPITRTRRGVATLSGSAGTSWTLNDAGGATAPGRPPQKAPRGPFHQGPFPLLNARSAKPTVRHLSLSLAKSPKGTLRLRQNPPQRDPTQRDPSKKRNFHPNKQ
jgi:hypothetical protein